MACVKKIQIDDTIYEAKTDFRTAIECNRIALDETIGDFERALGVICTLFGKDGLNVPEHYERLLKWAKKWLSCGKEIEPTKEEPDMDFIQDYDYIVASFQSDYNINLDEAEMDWHRFMTLMNGLSNSELGNCCVLNRIRNLRNFDVSQIKDNNERQKIAKAKSQVALKKPQKDVKLTEEQQKSVDEFYKSLGF
jgi:hypothetical protein